MNSKPKKFLRWVSGIFFSLLLLGGLALYTLISPNVGFREINKNSYCYCVHISTNIKNTPLLGLQGNPIYYATGINFNQSSSTSAYQRVIYQSDKSAEEIIYETKKHFNSAGLTNAKSNCGNYPQCLNCCAEFKGKDSTISVIISLNEDGDRKSADTNKVHVTEKFATGVFDVLIKSPRVG